MQLFWRYTSATTRASEIRPGTPLTHPTDDLGAKQRRRIINRGQIWQLGVALFAVMVLAQPIYGQDKAATVHHFYLVPAATTSVRLHTHTADIDLGYDGGPVVAAVAALYRLQNTSTERIALTLKLVAEPAAGAPLLPDNLVVMVNQQPLAVTQAEDDSPVVQVQIPADSTIAVELNYSLQLDDEPLTTLAYSPRPLRQWLGEPSLRVSLGGSDLVPEEGWLRIAPEGWNFAPGATAAPRIRWLYDAPLPTETFVFSFIHPATWQSLVQATADVRPGAPVTSFLRLGELYSQLSVAAADQALRDRFFAQGVAAYSAGIDSAAATQGELAALHAGLATLYRTRSVGVDGTVDRTYMDLMTAEADQALTALPPDDPQRTELLQWQVEGLTLQLNEARDRRDWPAAFAVVERLATLPPHAVDGNTLAETKRALAVHQALELLEQGDNEAAMRLAGAQVSDAELQPPPAARPLFATWQVTVTIAPGQVTLVCTVQPVPGRTDEAHSALDALVRTWETADRSNQVTVVLQPLSASSEPEDSAEAIRLTLTLPANVGANNLARVTPPGADWALVRTLLAQLAPEVEQTTQLLRQQVRVSQPLDLRSTHEQWTSIAATLDQQANQFEAQSPNINLAAADTVVVETALLARSKAANYRAAATAWRTLARNSLVAVQLSAGMGVPPVTRTWLATPETPLQTLELAADFVSAGRLLLLAVASFAGLFLLAGALWWLL